MDVVHIVLLCTESEVALIVEPDPRRIVVLHQNPLPYVEFSVHYHQWVLYVLLSHVLYVLPENTVHDLTQLYSHLDASSPR